MPTSTKEHWRLLNSIFEAASQLGPNERDAFLREACLDNDKLRSEVEAIFSGNQRASDDGFLSGDAFEKGARLLARDVLQRPATGQTIDRFTIISELGRGGMGTIYLAEREDFHQHVALKVIKRGMDTDEIIRRFEQEREVLASLNHPNIARLVDGGTTNDGLPYIAMEYVEGLNISRYCEQNSLGLEERLILFRKVCAAVSYAHQNLVIHRDIKPSNILIDKVGEPKLLDFGIAKLLTSDGRNKTTEPAFRLLTPEYASPEQIRGDHVATASDVYSLGVVLYELLTGAKPYEITKHNPVEMIKVVCDSLPRAPSSIGRDSSIWPIVSSTREKRDQTKAKTNWTSRLAGDLDNIVLKALAKETLQRYASVEQLDDDISRYLVGLPVRARKATLRYRVSKFVERNKAVVAVSTVALLLLLGGFSFATWQAYTASRERAIAEHNFQQVRNLSRTLVSGWDEGVPAPAVSDQVRGRIAELATSYLDALTTDTNDPELLMELGDGYLAVAHNYTALELDLNRAAISFDKALEIGNRLEAMSLDNISVYRWLGKVNDKYSGYLGAKEKEMSLVFRDRAIRSYSKVVEMDPNDAVALFELANMYAHFGGTLVSSNRRTESFPYYQKANEVRMRRIELLKQREASTENLVRLASSYFYVAGDQTENLNDHEAAQTNFRAGLSIIENALQLDPNSNDALRTASGGYHELGRLEKRFGRLNESLSAFERGLELIRRRMSIVPGGNYDFRKEYDNLVETAEIKFELGERENALKSLNEAVNLRRDLTKLQVNTPTTYYSQAFMFNAASKLYIRMGERRSAAALIRDAVLGLEKKNSTGFNDDKNINLLGNLYLLEGDLNAGLGVCDLDRTRANGGLGGVYYCSVEG